MDYLRMPLSGPGPAYRSRVASSPTVKTPAMKKDRDHLNIGFAETMIRVHLLQL